VSACKNGIGIFCSGARLIDARLSGVPVLFFSYPFLFLFFFLILIVFLVTAFLHAGARMDLEK
jgi:hypothetical protein